MRKNELMERMCACGIVPVFRTENISRVIPTVKACYEGGIPFGEFTMTMPGVLRLLEKAVAELPAEVTLGIGTVLDGATARSAICAGAKFIVAPSLSAETMQMCHRYGVMVVPGVMTPTEITQAMELGAEVVKIFPASCVTPMFFRLMKGVFPQVRYVASGRLTVENAAEFVAAGADIVSCLGEGLDAEAFKQGDFEKIKQAAVKFLDVVQKAKKGGK